MEKCCQGSGRTDRGRGILVPTINASEIQSRHKGCGTRQPFVFLYLNDDIRFLDLVVIKEFIKLSKPMGVRQCATLLAEPDYDLVLLHKKHLDWPDGYNNPALKAVWRGALVSGVSVDQSGKVDYEDMGSYFVRKMRVALNAETRQQQQQQAEARRQQVRQQDRNAFRDFERTNRITTWPAVGELKGNPFRFEGMTVGVVAKFERMVSSTDVLFTFQDRSPPTRVGRFGSFISEGEMVVSGTPSRRFSDMTYGLLAGRVVGLKELSEPLFGGVKVLHLRFGNFQSCRERWCYDLAAGRSN